MLVTMWMTRDPATVRPTASIAAVATAMARRRFRHLLVTDRPGAARVLGTVSLHDLARAYPPDVDPLSAAGWSRGPRRQVAEIMSRDPWTVTPDASLEDAARLMLERKVGALPVVRDDTLVGIISDADVLRALLEVMGVRDAATAADAAGVRVTFDVSEGEDAVGFVLERARERQMQVASVLTMRHEGKRLAVARLVGGDIDDFVESVWRSGHRVLSVLRT